MNIHDLAVSGIRDIKGSFNELYYYAAGIIDGEGYIGIIPNGRSYTASIQVLMTRTKATYLLYNLFGGKLYFPPHPQGNRQQALVWFCRKADEVKYCLENIQDKLLVKREQALTVLQYLDKCPLRSDDFELRKAFYDRLKNLNQAGTHEIQA